MRKKRVLESETKSALRARLVRMEALMLMSGQTLMDEDDHQQSESSLSGGMSSTTPVAKKTEPLRKQKGAFGKGVQLAGTESPTTKQAQQQTHPEFSMTCDQDTYRRSLGSLPWGASKTKTPQVSHFEQEERLHASQSANWEHYEPGSWLSICSKPGLVWVFERTGRSDFIESIAALTKARTRKLELDRDRGLERAPYLDAETAWGYSRAYFEESHDDIFGIIHRPTFEARLRVHLERDESSQDDPAWYALRNTVYASGCRKLLSKSHAVTFFEAQAHAWQFFEKALSVHTQLLYSSTGISAVQALVAMGNFVQGLGNPEIECMLFSNAIRLAQSKGLHRQVATARKERTPELPDQDWLFWAIYCCEKILAQRSGRPSMIDDDDISCEIPQSVAPGSIINIETFTYAIKLARISSTLSKRLFTVKAFQQTPEEVAGTIHSLNHDLEQWWESLPRSFKLSTNFKRSQLPPGIHVYHVIYLRYAYCGCLIALHTVYMYPWMSAIYGLDQTVTYSERMSQSASTVAEASRIITSIARYIEIEAASPAWLAFYFPMISLINLFIFILKFPTLPSTQSDVALLNVVADHFCHFESLTSSEIAFPFTREVAAVAQNVVNEANEIGSITSTAQLKLPINDVAWMDVDFDSYNNMEHLYPADCDMNNWDYLTSGALDDSHRMDTSANSQGAVTTNRDIESLGNMGNLTTSASINDGNDVATEVQDEGALVEDRADIRQHPYSRY